MSPVLELSRGSGGSRNDAFCAVGLHVLYWKLVSRPSSCRCASAREP